ncbi:Dyp-type peroxidase [Phlegmacium glaucopus]|nr:Dyp-type peroxidase [Phlegmacium glaucopus]
MPPPSCCPEPCDCCPPFFLSSELAFQFFPPPGSPPFLPPKLEEKLFPSAPPAYSIHMPGNHPKSPVNGPPQNKPSYPQTPAKPIPEKSRPLGFEISSGYMFAIPVGWRAQIATTSKRAHQQKLQTQYDRDGRTVKNSLIHRANDRGQKMQDPMSGSDLIRISDFKSESTLALEWSGRANSSNAVLNHFVCSKVVDMDDEIIYEIKVFDEAEATEPDQITTVQFILAAKPKDPLNLLNIQGDVFVSRPGLPKALEYFYYFQIADIAKFKEIFRSFALPKIVTSSQLVENPPPPAPDNPNHPFIGFNVGFTSSGLRLFGLDPTIIGDKAFTQGQLVDSQNLGDLGVSEQQSWSPDWDPEYKVDIHGIFLITAFNKPNAQRFIQELERAFTFKYKRSAIKMVANLHGYPRPGAQAMNDPLGFRGGGLSNPQVKDVTFSDLRPMKFKGTAVVPMGVFVMGREGDEDKDRRPAWAVDGSLIATRKLNCLVPEFDEFCMLEGSRVLQNLEPEQAAEKYAARLMGRWKNGTSIEMSPDNDAPEIAKDDSRVNNFEFDQSDKDQQRCPFAAHMRKSNPRNDVPPSERLKHLIRRHNMPYGPEVTDEERTTGKTIEERGLHLCTYQSSIERGFRWIQCAWYNNPAFPPGKPVEPGWDPVLGQTGSEDKHRHMSGANPTNPRQKTTFPERFIDPRGGGYFFAPSLKTLREHIAA